MSNLHKFYYKEYFSGLDYDALVHEEEYNRLRDDDPKKRKVAQNKSGIKDQNAILTAGGFGDHEHRTKPEFKISLDSRISPEDGNRFELKVAYPGLVTGVGISHEVKIEGEFKLGVHFDWTRGMPVVYGSSVKGVLRNWFADFKDTADGIDTGDLLMHIFSGEYLRDYQAEKKKYGDNWAKKVKDVSNRIYQNRVPSYDRDVFFDAVIVGTDPKGRILCSDSITPHGGDNHDNPLKNPKPLTFVKIAPGCTLEFRFQLHPSQIPVQDENGNWVKENGVPKTREFSAAQKLALFKEILTTVGVGAKTRVGYGQLESL